MLPGDFGELLNFHVHYLASVAAVSGTTSSDPILQHATTLVSKFTARQLRNHIPNFAWESLLMSSRWMQRQRDRLFSFAIHWEVS
jgi:hypothetical protein